MFESLINRFPETGRILAGGDFENLPFQVRSIIETLGGITLDRGFYRFHSAESSAASNRWCSDLVSGFSGAFYCFAFDWLGRELAVDIRNGKPDGNVIAVDPGGGEYLRTDCSLSEWHSAVAGPEDPLAHPFYQEWRAANPDSEDLRFDEVIGYRVPLFLGGADEVENLGILPREVYFSICTQLVHGTAHLMEGETIDGFVIGG